MRRTALDRAHRGHQSLSDHLATKDALPTNLRRTATEKVHFQGFEVENVQQILDGGGHGGARIRSKSDVNLLCCDGIYKECPWTRPVPHVTTPTSSSAEPALPALHSRSRSARRWATRSRWPSLIPRWLRHSRRTRVPRPSPRPRGDSLRQLRCGMRLRPTPSRSSTWWSPIPSSTMRCDRHF